MIVRAHSSLNARRPRSHFYEPSAVCGLLIFARHSNAGRGTASIGCASRFRYNAEPGLGPGNDSDALSGEEKKERAAGCDDYVPKPFSPRQLLAKIRKFLQ